MNSNLWIEEHLEDFLQIKYRVDEILYSGKSSFQSVDVVKTRGYGKMLLNDGLVMVSEKDEFIYHDMIAHIPLFVHPEPENVLVIGGGDGGTVREVCRHESVKKCVMVEIDKMVVDASRKYLPTMACGMDNPQVDVQICDGVDFVKNTEDKFDVVLVDSTDPIGPATPLFGSEFYSDVHRILSQDGIVVSQGESPFYYRPMQRKLLSLLGKFFPVVSLYNFTNMTYPGGFWSFSFASKKYHPLKDMDFRKVENSRLNFDFYNSEVHRASFALPEFMQKEYRNLLKV